MPVDERQCAKRSLLLCGTGRFTESPRDAKPIQQWPGAHFASQSTTSPHVSDCITIGLSPNNSTSIRIGTHSETGCIRRPDNLSCAALVNRTRIKTVSYTHLTLPTSDLV